MTRKKQSLQRPSDRLAQRGATIPAQVDTSPKITFQSLAFGLTFANYSSPLVKEGCRLKMAEIKMGLGYESAPELERLLIDEIAMCWLRIGEAEAMYSQIMSGTHDADKAMYAERRLSACHARYTRSCESLARVRRLSGIIPAVQVNIAERQIVMR